MKRIINTWYSLDWVTFFLFLVLVTLGWINIYAAEYNEDYTSIISLSQRYGKQFLWIIAAIGLAVVILIIDSKFYSVVAYLVYGLTILLLIAVLIFGKEINGAKSWFRFGNLYFQPSEFAKFGTSLALAKYLSTFNISLKKFKTWVIIAMVIGCPVGLIILQPDFGSTLVYTALVIMLYREGLSGWLLALGIFISTLFILTLSLDRLIVLLILIVISYGIFYILNKSLKQVIISAIILGIIGTMIYFTNRFTVYQFDNYYLVIAILGLSSLVFIIISASKKIAHVFLVLVFLFSSIAFTYSVNYVFYNILESHQRHRVNILLGIESDPLGVGYNVNQSKIAIGSGGFSGKGFLQGTQTKFDFVPEQSTDFIFCTVGEEWGFIGTSVTIILFVILLLRIIFIAERQRSAFSRIFGYCVFSILFFHFIINIGMTIGLFPVIGIPLPFFSYGGSSLWAFTLLLFVLLRLDASRMELLH